jgi:hypothetical protein
MFCVGKKTEIRLTGARTSTREPKLEKSARASSMSVAPTVQADASEAGEKPLASAPSLPAATARNLPALTMEAAAELMAFEAPPPRDMLTTEPLGQSSAALLTNSMPATTPELVPLPSSPRTLTAKRVVFLATPKVAPPTVPATWVPWPWTSPSLESAKLAAKLARPSKSCMSCHVSEEDPFCTHQILSNPLALTGWSTSMPVSRM